MDTTDSPDASAGPGMPKYIFLDHSTDALVEAWGGDMSEALESAAYATLEIMLDRRAVAPNQNRDVSVESTTIHDLLYGWLEEIIYQTVTEGFAVSTLSVAYAGRPGQHTIRATLRGEPLDASRHRFGVEIKAPTYHEMDINQSDGVALRFLMDL